MRGSEARSSAPCSQRMKQRLKEETMQKTRRPAVYAAIAMAFVPPP